MSRSMFGGGLAATNVRTARVDKLCAYCTKRATVRCTGGPVENPCEVCVCDHHHKAGRCLNCAAAASRRRSR